MRENNGQFQKGKKKTGGRKKGSKNKATSSIKERIKEYIDSDFDTILNDINQLDPQERIKTFLKLLEFVLPKEKQSQEEGEQKIYTLSITPTNWAESNIPPVFTSEHELEQYYKVNSTNE